MAGSVDAVDAGALVLTRELTNGVNGPGAGAGLRGGVRGWSGSAVAAPIRLNPVRDGDIGSLFVDVLRAD